VSQQYENLGEYLSKTRTRLEDFAARVGVSESYVSMLANGQRTPSLPLALRIAAAANIPVASLLPPADPAQEVA